LSKGRRWLHPSNKKILGKKSHNGEDSQVEEQKDADYFHVNSNWRELPE
jgi:hypothetical protein